MMEPIDLEWMGVGWERIDRLYAAEQAAIEQGGWVAGWAAGWAAGRLGGWEASPKGGQASRGGVSGWVGG